MSPQRPSLMPGVHDPEWDGANPLHRACARAEGYEWAAAYIHFDHTRDVENVGTGVSWFDNPNGDQLTQAFDDGLADGFAYMSDAAAAQSVTDRE